MSTGAPLPPSPAYQNVPPPPASSSNTVLKIVLIVVGVFVLLGIIVAGVLGFTAYKMSRSIRRNSNGDVSISTSNGSITTGRSANISAADLGTVLYPGASSSNEGSMNMKTPNGSMVTSVFTVLIRPIRSLPSIRKNLATRLLSFRQGTEPCCRPVRKTRTTLWSRSPRKMANRRSLSSMSPRPSLRSRAFYGTRKTNPVLMVNSLDAGKETVPLKFPLLIVSVEP